MSSHHHRKASQRSYFDGNFIGRLQSFTIQNAMSLGKIGCIGGFELTYISQPIWMVSVKWVLHFKWYLSLNYSINARSNNHSFYFNPKRHKILLCHFPRLECNHVAYCIYHLHQRNTVSRADTKKNLLKKKSRAHNQREWES